MTAHDDLGSVRADRRKDRESPTPARSTPTVDVAEGRRLLAAVEATFPLSVDEADALNEWLDDNLPALLDAAGERDSLLGSMELIRQRLADTEWSSEARDRNRVARLHAEGVLEGRANPFAFERAERDAARAELTALKEGIKALADEWDTKT
jgi:hypothetical protein